MSQMLRPSVDLGNHRSIFHSSLSVSTHNPQQQQQQGQGQGQEQYQHQHQHRRRQNGVAAAPFSDSDVPPTTSPTPEQLAESMESKTIATCDYSNVEDLRLLLQEGVDINQTAEDGNTPLAVAAFHGDIPVAEFLVEHGADTNLSTVQGAPPLYWAARNGHVRIVHLLCRHGADPNQQAQDGLTPLACAALEGHADCVLLLLQLQARPNLHSKETQETPLYWAAHEGKFQCLRILLEHGAEAEQANRVGETPLFWAARNGHADCVECLLVSGGADPNAVTWDKQAAIFWAAHNSHHDCLTLLLEHGADPNVVTKALNRCITTPLEAALHNFDKKSIKSLHEHGATEDFTVHKRWHDDVDAEFLTFLLELDWVWESKQALLESAVRNIRDDQIVLKLLLARLPDVNRESSERRTILLLMLEFYLYILWVHCFVSVAVTNINDSSGLTNNGGPGTVLGLTAIFFGKEFVAAQQQGRRYFCDPWNYIDMAAITLVSTAMVKFILGHNIVGGEKDMFRNIVISAGAMLCLSFIGYLKATFLPFSNFVGGVTRVSLKNEEGSAVVTPALCICRSRQSFLYYFILDLLGSVTVRVGNRAHSYGLLFHVLRQKIRRRRLFRSTTRRK
jgi:ankyrin repeat protein